MPENQTKQDGNTAVIVSWAQGFETPAQCFARANKLAIINESQPWRGLCFHLDKKGWFIIDHSAEQLSPFTLMFKPKRKASGKDPLLKAIGSAQTVLDMTAGWGTDALHIAQSGKSVVALERNPVVIQLLHQAHLKLSDETLKKSLTFIQMDASNPQLKANLSRDMGINTVFDLVYLDPMFEGKPDKSAKAKKPMRLMHRLNASPCAENERALFEQAMTIATKRVVVKRALKAPYIAQAVPQGSIKSKLLRFDLYHP